MGPRLRGDVGKKRERIGGKWERRKKENLEEKENVERKEKPNPWLDAHGGESLSRYHFCCHDRSAQQGNHR